MFGDSLNSKLLLLAGLALFAINPVGAQTTTGPALTVTQLTASSDDARSFGATHRVRCGRGDIWHHRGGRHSSIYSVDATGHPELLGTLSPSNLAPGGIALANGILAVKGLDSSGNGLVYVYSEKSATPTVPQILSSGEPTPDSTFGSSIAIWNQTILVGAPGLTGSPMTTPEAISAALRLYLREAAPRPSLIRHVRCSKLRYAPILANRVAY